MSAARLCVLVLLGASATSAKSPDAVERGKQALLGRAFRVSVQRGQFVPSPLAPLATATVHPSSILRAPDDHTRRDEMARFVADLKTIAEELARGERMERG